MAVIYTAAYAAAAAYPMTHARILWDRLGGAVAASSEEDGFAAENAARIDTASWWIPAASPATWEITFAVPRRVDAVGIAAHKLVGAEVTIQVLIDGVWHARAVVTPADNSALLVLFEPSDAVEAVQIVTDTVARVGVISVGAAFVMLREGYSALGLADLGRQATLTSYVSEGGQLMGRFIQRLGLAAPYAWEHLPEDWYRDVFDPFAVSALTEPFFIAARPEGYPQDCAYAWVDSPIVPKRMGVRNFLSVDFAAKGHADA